MLKGYLFFQKIVSSAVLYNYCLLILNIFSPDFDLKSSKEKEFVLVFYSSVIRQLFLVFTSLIGQIELNGATRLKGV